MRKSVIIFIVSITLIIITFAILYYCAPVGSFESKLSVVEAIYFSFITITTLGYDDIVPGSDPIRLLVSLQYILGLVAIGLFINSVWGSY
ncbi:hypothetical protein GCM10011369_32440 [Neiella marina]|uniref:Potassium channel domain-containing protein n=1 Tax=Neiella marina TaxID=508461 RepID=A0A8J2U9M3_9GAMM|nr:potassium channel family protein [Neiella marina]GGA87873.1 hypothetical protein GCM10011369_32440 [Neiella marina]